MKEVKKIFYKNYTGKWVESKLSPTSTNLNFIKKTKALNGQATIQTVTK